MSPGKADRNVIRRHLLNQQLERVRELAAAVDSYVSSGSSGSSRP
jgi:hypothetical protein